MRGASFAVENLTAGYGPTRVVENVSFSVRPGGRLALLGRNGVGKTTLLAAAMGLAKRHGGMVRIGDRGGALEIGRWRPSARARAGLGYVPQTRNVFPSLTVEENLFTGLKGRARHATAEAYALFPRLAERRHHPGASLSGGEQQMLAMARTLLGRPSVLLLDEPLEGLAPVICDELMAALTGLAEGEGLTMVLVEQQIGRALAFADQVAILDRGLIVWAGTPEGLRAAPGVVERHLGIALHQNRS